MYFASHSPSPSPSLTPLKPVGLCDCELIYFRIN